MAKLKIKDRFATTPVALLNNENVSLKAKGLYGYLQSKPDNWDFTLKGIVSQLKEGFDAVREAVKELENEGYLIRTNYQNQLGQWDCDYELFSETQDSKPLNRKKPYREKPYREKPHTVNTVTVKPLCISKKELSKKEEVKENEFKNIQKEILETKNEVQTYKTLDQDNFENPIYKNQDQLDELLQEFAKLEYQNGLYNLEGFEFDRLELRAIWRDFEGWCRTKNINENISLKLSKWIRTTKNITEPTPNFPPPPIQTKEELEAYDINELLKLRPIIKKTATYA